MKALYNGEYSKTYQAYHPGISLMWVIGLSSYSNLEYYSKENFLNKDYQVKISIYLLLTLFFAVSLYILKDFLRYHSLILFGLIYTLEPFILGVRRLVHLEALMTAFLFLSFLFLLKNSFIRFKYLNLIVSSLFFVLAFYTKSSAILILPLLLLTYFISPTSFLTKFKGIFITLFSIILFLYLIFPGLWKNPIEKSVIFYEKIYQGASLIGYEGRREVGTSGTSDNLILKKSHTRVNNFYYDSLIYVSSPLFLFLILLSFVVLIIYSVFLFRKDKLRTTLGYILSKQSFYIGLLSFLGFLSFFVAYSISVKSYERYSYVFYPFIILFLVNILNLINKKYVLIISCVYLTVTSFELSRNYPYYYSYGNSLLGGSLQRYEKLNSPSFGVAIYELNNRLTSYIREKDSDNFPVIAGNKTLKTIFKDGRNERYPLCDVDYMVKFYDDKPPHEVCIGKAYTELFTVKVSNIDYWTVYKFKRQSSKIKKISDVNKSKINEVTPDTQSLEE